MEVTALAQCESLTKKYRLSSLPETAFCLFGTCRFGHLLRVGCRHIEGEILLKVTSSYKNDRQ